MKKIVLLCLTVVLLFSVSLVLAEDWECPKCGRTNQGNFCPICGTEKPVLWTCAVCGKENFALYCENCGAEKPNDDPVSDPFIPDTGLFRNDGGLMNDTLYDGDIVLASSSDYGSDWLCRFDDSNNAIEQAPRITFGTPNRFDVVVCRYPTRGAGNFIKRIVGMPGEYVALKEGYLYINGSQQEAEKTIGGVPDEYRKGGIAYTYPLFGGAYYVPQKGDTVVIEKDGDSVALKINNNSWDRMQTCLVMKTAEGKTLKLYDRNIDENSRDSTVYDVTTGKKLIYTETVFSYNGLFFTPAMFCYYYPDLIGQELMVDEDYYFVMGDHRNNSNDSRSVGALERSAIIRHVVGVVSPESQRREIR